MKRQSPPTEYQTLMLRRIAQTGRLMLTRTPEGGDRYSDGSGRPIPDRTAKVLIRKGWVIPERDSMFDEPPQSWLARKP